MTKSLLSALFALLLLLLLRYGSGCQELNLDKLEHVHTLRLTSATGPESLAFDGSGGGPYTGVSGGQILKWHKKHHGWAQFAVNSKHRKLECVQSSGNIEIESVCGRPLGLQFHRATNILYIADAYLGLLAVGRSGGPATQLAAAAADGVPFHFTNAVDVDQVTGVVYFTDSSTRFRRPDYLMIALTGDSTGRLLKYDPRTKSVTVLTRGLPFPNGVALTADRSSLLIAESGNCRIIRYWLYGPKAGTVDVFADLIGYPDNIKRTAEGEFWVAFNTQKFQSNSSSGEAGMVAVAPGQRVVAVKLSREGKILKVLTREMTSGSVSEVVEKNGTIWIGSVDMAYVGVYKL